MVLFRGDDHVPRSVGAALDMQRRMSSSSVTRRADLSMTVGVADGPFDVFVFGSRQRHMLVSGERAGEVIRLEQVARAGETVVAASMADRLPPELRVELRDDGWVVDGVLGFTPGGPAVRDLSGAELIAHIPAAVREQLAAFAGLGGEHRLVTVGFLAVDGIDRTVRKRGPDAVAAALHELADATVRACDDHGVTVLHTTTAIGGSKFVLCAGAPVSHGDTGDAMLRAALRIAALDSPFELRVGVQTGRVFAGFLGAAFRHTYTLMGDAVNTSARLLGRADDRDVVAHDAVVGGTRSVFDTVVLEPFSVKGKSQPVQAHRVTGTTDRVRRDTSSTALVGRDTELELLAGAIGRLDQVIEIAGPAGIGKSRLLDAAWDRAQGLQIFQAACTPYGAGSPYGVFRPLMRSGVGIDVHSDARAAGRSLAGFVADAAPHLLPWVPLLAVPFGVDVPPTPESEAIDPTLRRARINEVVVELFDAVLDNPALLVVEDVHWIDDASADLLAHLVRASVDRPWSAVVTRRPGGTWQLPDVAHGLVIELAPLGDDAIRRLAVETSHRPLSDADLDAIVGRAQGNSLFAVELARALDTDARSELPGSIEALIAARIDALPPDQRSMLRVAAVLGPSFDETQLTAVVALDDGAKPPSDLLDREGDGTYRWQHQMYRDVAYEGLPYRERRRLHGRIALHLEAAEDRPDRIAPVLAMHFSEGGMREQAWQYGRVAGSQAETQYAHREAAAAYGRALDAGAGLRSVGADERRDVARHLGDALLAVGDFDGAYAAYGRSRGSAAGLEAVDLMRRQGIVRDRQGRLHAASRWFARCLAELPASGGTTEERSARLDVDLSFAAVRHRQGRFADCLMWAERAAAEAAALGDRASLAKALDRLHVATTYLDRTDAHRFGPEALALHRELDDHLSEARILDNMGIQAYFGHEWDRAIELYGAASIAGRRAGDVIEGNLGRANAAEIWSDRGRFDIAEHEFEEVLRNWSAAGWAFGETGTRSNLALVRARRGDPDPGLTHEPLLAALTTFRELGANEFIVETQVRLVEAAVHLGDDALALAAAEEARPSVDGGGAGARLERCVGLAHALRGDVEAATAAIHLSLDHAGVAGARYELGLSEMALGAVTDESYRVLAGAELLRALGVVALPAAFDRLGVEMPPASL